MDILFLSSYCSEHEYERMFRLYGSALSHASQKFNRLFVRGLMENGYHVDALTQRMILDGCKNDLWRESETENCIDFTYIPLKANRWANRISIISFARKYILKWTKEHPNGIVICDIILGELSIAVYLASKVRKFKKAAIVTDVPSIRAGDNRKGIKAIPVKLKNSLISKYDGYVFLTEQMNIELNKKNRPYVVVEGFADDKVADQPNTLDDKHSEKVVMMAGLLEAVFGVETLLHAFEKIDDENAKLLFYGKGKSVGKIEEASRRDPRIVYCGEKTNEQIVCEEKKATLLVNPRPPVGVWTAYSFPSKNMEYMASGTPLVAYVLPCIPEEYRPHFYAIEEDSVEGMKKILERLLSKRREEIHDFGIEAQKWILEHKTPRKSCQKVSDMLKKI